MDEPVMGTKGTCKMCGAEIEYVGPYWRHAIPNQPRHPATPGGSKYEIDLMLKLRSTERGFARAEFTDRYGKTCSIQKSSLATEDAIWLGCDEGTHVEGQCLARMHLTQEMVAALLPLLHRFVETGELK